MAKIYQIFIDLKLILFIKKNMESFDSLKLEKKSMIIDLKSIFSLRNIENFDSLLSL